MSKLYYWFRRFLGIRTQAERFQDGIDYVNDSLKKTSFSTKDEGHIAETLWRECYPSFEGNNSFDRGMQLRLTELGYDSPDSPRAVPTPPFANRYRTLDRHIDSNTVK